MKKTFILLTITAVIFSCKAPLHLHESGIYTIKERNGNETQFYEVAGKYNVISDTLKKDDKIVINVIKARPFKKAGKPKAEIAKSAVDTEENNKSYVAW